MKEDKLALNNYAKRFTPYNSDTYNIPVWHILLRTQIHL